MKCEICHKADAAAVLNRTENGVTKELYVCKACAAAAKRPPKKHAPAAETDDTVTVVGDGEEPPEFVKNLVDATLGFMKGVAEDKRRRNKVCPQCHAKWDALKDAGRIKCPACWQTFAPDIRETFLQGAYGPVHNGAMPPGVEGEDTRAFLERELKAAVGREDFRKAAEIKRKLAALGGGDAAEEATA